MVKPYIRTPEIRRKNRLAILGEKNYNFGRKFSEEHKARMGLAKLAENNPMWKAHEVGFGGLHHWVRRRLPKPELCQGCNKIPPYDLANKSGKYLRDLNDWEYLCRSCHMLSDGRMIKLHEPSAKRAEAVKKHWATVSKEERYARIKKGWIKRRIS